MSAAYEKHDAVAVITLNNPPVNGLGFATRSAIVAGIQQAQDDQSIKAIVIIGDQTRQRMAADQLQRVVRVVELGGQIHGEISVTGVIFTTLG